MEEEKVFRYLSGPTTEHEQKEIYEWFSKSRANQDHFYKLKAKYHASKFNETARDVDIDELYSTFKDLTLTKPSKNLHVLKYAAIALLLLSLGYSGYYYSTGRNNPKIDIPQDVITLKMPDGEIRVINEKEKIDITDSKGNKIGKQQGRLLVYNGLDTSITKDLLEYNTLTVPYAKQFELLLSDNTRVILNSGTVIKYPVKFVKGRERKVYLVGEAFFDVKKDTLHPFIVNANDLNIQVLGTRFNVSSYPEDDFINTVLQEGSVRVYSSNDEHDKLKEALLLPGEIAIWNKSNKKINISAADMDINLAWKDGKIVLKHTPFKNIIKKLERHYNVHFINNNPEFENESFTASFHKESIEEVLEAFKEGYGLNYTLQGNEIIINP